MANLMKLVIILNDYESESNDEFTFPQVQYVFSEYDAEQIVSTYESDPDYQDDKTIKAVSNAYHKIVEAGY